MEETKVTDFFEKNRKFYVELEFIEDNTNSAAALLKSVTQGSELMEGLVVKSLFAPKMTKEKLLSSKKMELIDELYAKINELTRKVTNEIIIANYDEIK